jgi:multicomponent Na+:H+ antiporter subunit E
MPNKERFTSWKKGAQSFSLTFVLMLMLWLIFSGKTEPLLLGFGVIASLIVSGFSHRFLFPDPNIRFYTSTAFKFSCYIPWLLAQIFVANIHLLRIVFHPRIREKIDPHIVDFSTRLKNDMPIATMANSITLTPGTITVTADQHGEFRVHAIDRQSSQALPGEMERKVAQVFGERR